ncbi:MULTISPECIES: isochorismatase family protein [unclassified Thioalkalivibrio]|uniref:isochorismatase family protein n=1 Tax=unclassified Thioalkalivibrio TaxID=2621013 RepID=UPI0003709217|nr:MULTISPECIES: isochorismatase family protein [unclassified Thioalkalivibrio]
MSGAARARCERSERSPLLLVDLQERLMAAMPETDRERTVRNAGRLVEAARQLGIPVEVSRQYPQGLGDTVEPLRSALEDLGDLATVTDKTAFSCCGEAALEQRLAGCHSVVIGGAETHVCVTQTALDLLDAGVTVFVAADAVCSRNPELRGNGLERLRAAGAIITNHESVLFEWLGDARAAEFKSVSQLLREV